jgi:hypothetical protein
MARRARAALRPLAARRAPGRIRTTILRHIFPPLTANRVGTLLWLIIGILVTALRGSADLAATAESSCAVSPRDASCYLTATGLRSPRASLIWA